MLGAILSFASAAFFGLNNAAARRGVLTATVLQGMALTVPLGLPVFLVFLPFFGGLDEIMGLSPTAWFWMSLAGIVHFVIGRYGNYRAQQALGANLSTPVQQLSILVSLVLAIWILGERMTVLKVLGLALVLFGPAVVLVRRGQSKKQAAGKAFVPEYGPGFFWGFVCALGYGVSPVMITLAMGEARSIAAGLAGVIVSYLAASVTVAIMVAMAGGRRYMIGMDRVAAKWFLVSTICVALSQMLRYMALGVAPVSVVTPIQRLSVVFRLFFGAALNRDTEIFDGMVTVGILLSVIGAVALAMEPPAARMALEYIGIDLAALHVFL